jgi:hypothetical protein
MHTHRSFGKSRVCRTGNAPVIARVHPNIRAPPQHRSEWLARACDAPCESQTGPNLGDRTEGDHVGVMPDMTEPVCSDMHAAPRPGPPGAGRLPLLSIKQRWAAAIFDLAFFAGLTRTAKRSTG